VVERSDTTGNERTRDDSIPEGSQRVDAGIPPGWKTRAALATGGGVALTTG